MALFRPTIDLAFASFARSVSERHQDEPQSIPLAAFKGLIRLALGVAPSTDLESYEDAIEWISNLDHDFDRNSFADLKCSLYRIGRVFPTSWAVLARRRDRDEPIPYLMFFLGFADSIIQLGIPLCQRDEILDGHEWDILPMAPPSPYGIEFEPVRRIALPIQTRRVVAGNGREK